MHLQELSLTRPPRLGNAQTFCVFPFSGPRLPAEGLPTSVASGAAESLTEGLAIACLHVHASIAARMAIVVVLRIQSQPTAVTN